MPTLRICHHLAEVPMNLNLQKERNSSEFPKALEVGKWA